MISYSPLPLFIPIFGAPPLLLFEYPSTRVKQLHRLHQYGSIQLFTIRRLTAGIAPENAKIPIAAVIAPHPRRSINAPAATGPNSVAAAMAQLKRAKACAYAPPGPKASGSIFSFSSTTAERSAATGETMRMSVKPAIRGKFSQRLSININIRRLEVEEKGNGKL
jgi:hypothetical protein